MELTSIVPRHFCSECGREVGLSLEPYRCVRTGRIARPHTQVRRETPRRRREPEFLGPDLNELLGITRPKSKSRPASRGKSAFRVDLLVGPVAGRLEVRGGAHQPAGDTPTRH